MAGGIVKDVDDMEKVVGMGQGDLFNGVLIEIEGTGSQKGGYDKNDDPIKIKPNELDKARLFASGAHNPPRSHRFPSPLLRCPTGSSTLCGRRSTSSPWVDPRAELEDLEVKEEL